MEPETSYVTMAAVLILTWRNCVKPSNLSLALAALSLALLLGLAGCTKETAEEAALKAPIPEGMVRGTVLETMDSGGYTYMKIEFGEEKYWYATQETEVAVGDVVQLSMGMMMRDFYAASLDRDFNVIYFSGTMQNLSQPDAEPVVTAAPAATTTPAMPPQGHPTPAPANAAPADVAVEAFEEGKDIAWLYASKDELAGQQVTLRGKVVKYNPEILGWNFLHLQDGSGSSADGNNDVIVTTTEEVELGQTVVVTGTIVLDKDFGAGYTYPVLIEDAALADE